MSDKLESMEQRLARIDRLNRAQLRHLRRKVRVATLALARLSDLPANGNSDPDVMASALTVVAALAEQALEALCSLDRQFSRLKRKLHG